MKVLIVGGGIGGLALGAALGRRGVEADIVERRPGYGEEGAGIVLGPNVMSVMKGLDLHEPIVAAGHAIGEARITDASGRVLQSTEYAMPDMPFPATAIHRTRLQQILRAAVPREPRTGTTVTEIRSGADGVDVVLSDGTSGRWDVVVGSDGIRSAVREHVCGVEVSPRYSGYTCWRFVVDGHFGDATVEMWGRGKRVGVVPLGEEKSYVFLTMNAAERAPTPFTNVAGLRAAYAEFGDPAAGALAALSRFDSLLHNDISDCSAPKWWTSRVVLLGDAAHAVTPNLGQGAGLAIEDAAALAAQLVELGPTDEALARYEAFRRPRASQIRDRSWTIGRVAQWENGLARAVRDFAVAWTPASIARNELERVVRDMPGVPVG